jgi:hypothetical protein
MMILIRAIMYIQRQWSEFQQHRVNANGCVGSRGMHGSKKITRVSNYSKERKARIDPAHEGE